MITITARGRLAFQPELKLLGKGAVCEFKLLSTRMYKGQPVTEAVTFVCFDNVAEDFCGTTVKGQEIEATGVQETQHYEKDGVKRSFVKYRLTWFARGFKPRSEYNSSEQHEASEQSNYARPGQRSPAAAPRGNRYDNDREDRYPAQEVRPAPRRDGRSHQPDHDLEDDDPPYY